MEQTNKNLPLVVIFGRTNVGKSTLFNCLTEKKQALTADIEGTTRDSNLGLVNWQNHEFELVDTGGIIDLKFLSGQNKKTDDIESKVQSQARIYLKKADLVILTVDAKTGLLPQDKQIALLIKKTVPIEKTLLLANKADSAKLRQKTNEFYKLGLGDPIAASAVNGSGTGDLLDEVISRLFPESCRQKNIQKNWRCQK
jgi:GTP-binding protein